MPDAEQLNLYDRLSLLEILQDTQGSLATLRMVREMKHALEFDEDEHAFYGFAEGPGGSLAVRNADTARTKAVHIPEPVRALIRQRLKAMDQGAQLRERHLGIVERFGIEEPVKLHKEA